MKNLFCLLACFCGFSLLVTDTVCSQLHKKVKVSTVNTAIESNTYSNCFCSITLIEKSLLCGACQNTGHLTPVLDRQHPTPDLFRLVLPDNDEYNSCHEDDPTPVLSDKF